MVKFIFSLGTIDKKLIVPLIYIIVHIFMHFYWEENGCDQVTFFIEYFGCALGETMNFFIGAIFRYRRLKRNKKLVKYKYFKDFSILFIIYTFYNVTNYFSEIEESSRELLFNEALEIVFITLITFFILKYKYYYHHFISIALILIIYLALDLLIGNFVYTGILPIVNQVLYIFADSFLYSYLKYLIEVKYYYFMDVVSVIGIMDLFLQLSIFSFLSLIQKLDNSKEIFFQFYELYNEFGILYMVERFLFGFLLNGFIVSLMEFIILDKLTPNFILIGYGIGRIPSAIYYEESWRRWIILLLSILQLISVLVYLEIIEFNFYNLNINTKRNISIRGMEQFCFLPDDEIIIEDYDFSEVLNNQEELSVKSEEKDKETN